MLQIHQHRCTEHMTCSLKLGSGHWGHGNLQQVRGAHACEVVCEARWARRVDGQQTLVVHQVRHRQHRVHPPVCLEHVPVQPRVQPLSRTTRRERQPSAQQRVQYTQRDRIVVTPPVDMEPDGNVHILDRVHRPHQLPRTVSRRACRHWQRALGGHICERVRSPRHKLLVLHAGTRDHDTRAREASCHVGSYAVCCQLAEHVRRRHLGLAQGRVRAERSLVQQLRRHLLRVAPQKIVRLQRVHLGQLHVVGSQRGPERAVRHQLRCRLGVLPKTSGHPHDLVSCPRHSQVTANVAERTVHFWASHSRGRCVRKAL
mmetsp:Transcript_26850/g.86333  ORF Transcript_26850/g.86333 Transcript_26850/m.86333 type:complete len:315 (-) Transcript_26850:347-1291(-)